METRITEGITIIVHSKYEPANSKPDMDYFAFSYQITIENHRKDTVQLLTRFWEIKDANGKVRQVEGAGVIGLQPTLAPGEHHSYQSWCPIATPFGTMSGYYVFENKVDGSKIKAVVPEFTLTAEFLLN